MKRQWHDADMQETYNIVIIGAGPRGTYALERLAALLPFVELNNPIEIVIFERTGYFGGGEVHNHAQTPTSYLNRVAGQVSFAADESNIDIETLLSATERSTFAEWCCKKFSETEDPRFKLKADDVPKRYLHGLALEEKFDQYVSMLGKLDKVKITLIAGEVIDVFPLKHKLFSIEFIKNNARFFFNAHHVLFVTGHAQHHPKPGFVEHDLLLHNKKYPSSFYIHYPYPLETQVSYNVAPAGSIVGVRGLGLSAIDVILYLTEGRGGQFKTQEDTSELIYIASGQEPRHIVGISNSGIVYACRPINMKFSNPQQLEHQGIFFTKEAVAKLRHHLGKQCLFSNGRKGYQLDFERHIFPLIILEMAFLYYQTLLGRLFGAYIKQKVYFRYEHFLSHDYSSLETAILFLLEPVQNCFEEFILYSKEKPKTPDEKIQAIYSFCLSKYSTEEETTLLFPLPYYAQTDLELYKHRFNWQAIFDPLSTEQHTLDWQIKNYHYLRQDLRDALENNLFNPTKAACDGVWRDLRPVFSEVLDNGGILSESHKKFISHYLRYYNRLSNGAGIEAMQKILALIKHGILDVSIGPLPIIKPIKEGGFLFMGSVTKIKKEVDAIVDAKLHTFDPELSISPLYPNLLQRGLIRKWYNPSLEKTDVRYYPGGIDLTDQFHPYQQDGTINTQLTFMGAPSEGVLFFNMVAARPYSNSRLFNEANAWVHEVLKHMSEVNSVVC